MLATSRRSSTRVLWCSVGSSWISSSGCRRPTTWTPSRPFTGPTRAAALQPRARHRTRPGVESRAGAVVDRSGAVHASHCRRCGPETVPRFQSPSRQGESHPLPLTEPCIRLSTYTARGAHAAVPGCGQPCRLLPRTVVGPHDHPGHPACFAPPALPGFIATTRQSAPVRCIGTLPLAVSAA